MKKSLIQYITIIPFVFLLCNTFCCLKQGEEVAKLSLEQTKIAFVSLRDANGEIYVMNADGSEQTNLTNNPAGDWVPCWSPDGKIVFESERDANAEIYIMNADGSEQTNLTNNPASDGFPCWSPDGKKIAFQSDRDGNNEIYIMNVDGSEQKRLTNNRAQDMTPSWSPFLKMGNNNTETYFHIPKNKFGNYLIMRTLRNLRANLRILMD